MPSWPCGEKSNWSLWTPTVSDRCPEGRVTTRGVCSIPSATSAPPPRKDCRYIALSAAPDLPWPRALISEDAAPFGLSLSMHRHCSRDGSQLSRRTHLKMLIGRVSQHRVSQHRVRLHRVSLKRLRPHKQGRT